MASKLNRKFIFVVGGFSLAAVLLLVAVILVNQLWLKNADRHIRAGDELMAQGKAREAYAMYGRAVGKKPDVVRYIEKMEEALSKVTADTPAQSVEDYRSLMALKRQHTRAQPGDPEQWKILIAALEDEAELYSRGDGWISIETVGKEMKEVMAPGSDGMKTAEEIVLFARAQREQVLTSGERTDLEKQLEAFLKVAPKSWRAWSALVSMRTADVARLRGAGQAQAASRRLELLDKSIADMRAAADPNDLLAQDAVASADLERALLDARTGNRMDRSKIDTAKLDAACTKAAEVALATGRGSAVRAVASRLVDAKGIDAGAKLLEDWLATHPTDLITAGLDLEYVSRAGDAEKGFDRTQVAARRILDQPRLPTGLMASIQSDTRARALQVLLEAAIVQMARGVDPAQKAKLDKEIVELRTGLLEALQNDETSPGMIAADAKILQSRMDLNGAAKKWELYFTKVPQPPADAFLWATMVSRAQNDLGLAMQTVTKGSDAFPSDLRLAIQRAEIATQLGRFAEAASFYEALAKALPDQEQYARMAQDVRSRAEGGRTEAAPEIAGLEAAMRSKDFPRARELAAAWVKSSDGSLQAMYAQVLVEQESGDKVAALVLLRKALDKYPGNPDLARNEALLATEDPVERIDMMIARVVTDPAQRNNERVRALRALRTDLERNILELRRANSPELARSEEFLKRINDVLPEAEKQVVATSAGDASSTELAFMDALSRGDIPAAELHLAAAAKLTSSSPILEVILRARLLSYQGRTAEAISVLEKARQAGSNQAPVAAQLAVIQESVGNEPAALALWKEAYDRRPNDLVNVRGYARSLGRSGQGRTALDMLRSAIAANQNDLETLTAAAQYEAVYGSRAKAIEHRQRILQIDSTNRENVGDLYALLYMPADFGSVRDVQGRPRYDARGWSTVPPDEQRRLLEDAKVMNIALAEQLYEAAMKLAPLDVRFAGRKATVMRENGKMPQGTKALQDVIARAEAEGKVTAVMYLEQGAYLEGNGDVAGADVAFAKAGALQDPKKREVDAALVEVESRRGNTKRAIELLTAVMGETPQLATLIRLADLQIVSRNYPDAQATLARVRPLLGAATNSEVQRQFEMLVSGVAAGEADELRNANKLDESNAKVDEALAALSRAETVAPADLFAPLRRVQLLRSISIAQQDPAKLDAAIAEADRLLARNAMYWPMVSMRVDLSLDKRDIKAAIGILERFLQAQPASDEARTRLIDMQIATGNVPRAIEVSRGGVDLRPQDPVWAERLGELLQRTNDSTGAAREFERAFTLDPKSMVYLEKSALARLGSGDAAGTLNLLRGASDLAARSTVLRAVSAAALAKSGRRDDGLIAGREALAAARTAPDGSIGNTERTVMVLREMFAADKTADFEAFLTQGGTAPTLVEEAILADTWSRSGPTGGDKALEWCSKVDARAAADAKSVPPSVESAVALTRGAVLYGRGDMEGACTAFVSAAQLSNSNPAALNNAAYLLTKVRKDYARAFEFATRAVLLAPAQPDYLDTLGFVLLQMGRLTDAEDALNKSVAVSPTTSGLLHLAQVRAAQGNIGDARQILDRARARPADPDSTKDIEAFAETLKGK